MSNWDEALANAALGGLGVKATSFKGFDYAHGLVGMGASSGVAIGTAQGLVAAEQAAISAAGSNAYAYSQIGRR